MNELAEKLQYEEKETSKDLLETSISFTVIGESEDLDSFEAALKVAAMKLAVEHGVELE